MEIRKISPLVNISIFLFLMVAIHAFNADQYLLTAVSIFSAIIFHILREALRRASSGHDAEHERCIRRGVKNAMESLGQTDRLPDKRYLQ